MTTPSGNFETLLFMCVIDTLHDLLQAVGPNSVIFKATSILLTASASAGDDTWTSGIVVCGSGVYTGVRLVSYRAGWPRLCSMFIFGSCMVPLWL